MRFCTRNVKRRIFNVDWRICYIVRRMDYSLWRIGYIGCLDWIFGGNVFEAGGTLLMEFVNCLAVWGACGRAGCLRLAWTGFGEPRSQSETWGTLSC